MKILLLSDSDSPHTIKWALSLRKINLSIGIFSIHKPNSNLYSDTDDIYLTSINASRELQRKKETSISKSIYFQAIQKVRKVIREFKPDIVHAHYASSYGLIGALSGFHPYIISTWGSDIYNFPTYSIIYKSILKFSLSTADKILATSHALKKETQLYTGQDVLITPFGVDTEKFYPRKVKSLFNENDIVIGTIKTLEKTYGIEFLIKAFSIVKKKYYDKPLKLLIVGRGTQRKYLENLVKELNLENDTLFTGYIEYDHIEQYHNMLSIFVAPSLMESFGVSILEASACGKPVIATKVGGIPEVIENEKTGFIVESENPDSLAYVLEKLIGNVQMRRELGNNGRKKVLEEYSWQKSLDTMVSIYTSLVKNDKT